MYGFVSWCVRTLTLKTPPNNPNNYLLKQITLTTTTTIWNPKTIPILYFWNFKNFVLFEILFFSYSNKKHNWNTVFHILRLVITKTFLSFLKIIFFFISCNWYYFLTTTQINYNKQNWKLKNKCSHSYNDHILIKQTFFWTMVVIIQNFMEISKFYGNIIAMGTS